MKKNLLIVLLLSLIFPYSIFAETISDVSLKLQNIGIYLNHQNFQKARELRKNLLKNISLDDLTKKLSYSDFITLAQTLSWEEKGEEFTELFRLRNIYHPEDSQNAALLARKDRAEYWKDCIAHKVILIDYIDSAMCTIYSDNIPTDLKKTSLASFIPNYYSQLMMENNLQNMSDFGNLITAYITIDPKKKVLYSSYQKKIGFQIIKKDPSWVNGYLFLISNSRILKEKNGWVEKLTKNYIGDKERWDNVIKPYIDYYN